MKVGILYVTFARDVEWMRFSLESIRKYATGFSAVTIVVPTWDVDKFLQFERYSTPDCPVRIKNFLEYPGKGFVHHLAMKCYADVFMPEMDGVIHLDPDCLACAPVSPDEYFVDGKAVLVIEPYEVLKTVHPARFNWKRVTENALKFSCTHETMCRHPAAHHKEVYRGLRDYMESVHLTPFYDYVIKQKNGYPQEFAEFPTLGAYAMKFHADKYKFIDVGDRGSLAHPPSKIEQLWSYTGAHSRDNAAAIKRILA